LVVVYPTREERNRNTKKLPQPNIPADEVENQTACKVSRSTVSQFLLNHMKISKAHLPHGIQFFVIQVPVIDVRADLKAGEFYNQKKIRATNWYTVVPRKALQVPQS